MDCSTPGFLVNHHLLELAQTHVHWVSDAIRLSCPLLFPSPPDFNLSQHQSLFQWVSSLHQVAKVLIEASAAASVFPMNIQGWFPSGFTGLISWQSKGLSRLLSKLLLFTNTSQHRVEFSQYWATESRNKLDIDPDRRLQESFTNFWFWYSAKQLLGVTDFFFYDKLLLLLSRFSRVWLCVTHRWQPIRLPQIFQAGTLGGLPFPSPMHEGEKWKWSRSVVSDSSQPQDCSLPDSSVHGIFQARVLEWGPIVFSVW